MQSSSYKNPCRCVGLLASGVTWTPSTGSSAAAAPSRPANGEFVSDSNRVISDDSSSFDGISPILGDRVAVLTSMESAYNGIYVVTDVGSGNRPWRMKRDDDANTADDFRVLMVIPVSEGTTYGKAILVNSPSSTFALNVDAIFFSSIGTQGAAVSPPLYKATLRSDTSLLIDSAGTLQVTAIDGLPEAGLKVRLADGGPLYAMTDFTGIKLGVDNKTIKVTGTDGNSKPAIQAHGTCTIQTSTDDIHIGSGIKPSASGIMTASASQADTTNEATIAVASTNVYRGIASEFVTSGIAPGVLDGTWTAGEKVYLGVDGRPTQYDDLPVGTTEIILGYAMNGSDLFVRISVGGTIAGTPPAVPDAPDFGVLASDALYTPIATNFNVIVSSQDTSESGLGILNPSLALSSDRKRYKKLFFGGSSSSSAKLLPSSNSGLTSAVMSEGFGPMENLPFIALDNGVVYAFLPYLTAKFNPETQTWSTSLPACPTSPSDGCAVFISATEVFVSTLSNKGAIFNTGTETWTETSVGSVTWNGGQRCVVLSNGNVIVFGGSNGAGGSSSAVARYVSGTNTWTAMSSMATERRRFGYALAAGDVVVVAGGLDSSDDSLDSVETYNAGTDTWTTAASSMSEARHDLRCVKLPGDNTTLIIWGRNATGLATTIDAYTGAGVVQGVGASWSDSGSQLVPRHSFAVMVFPLDTDYFNNQLTYNYELVIAGGANASDAAVTTINIAQSIDY